MDKENKQITSEKPKAKPYLNIGIKYLAFSLPLLFISPIVITIGFKALNKNNSYFILILGCVFAIITILLAVQGIRNLLKSIFDS